MSARGRLRVAVLCADDAHHAYLVPLLRGRFDVVAVVVEPGAAQTRRWRRIGRYRDYLAWVCNGWRRRLTGLDRRRRRYFRDPPPVPEGAVEPCLLEVAWINDPAVREILAQTTPDVIVVMGAGILGRELLAAIDVPILNVHGGYLPDYRGNHCFFWALYHGDFDRIGTTLHFVDEGIDSGDIVAHVVPEVRLSDDAETLYCRAEKLALHRLADLLADYEAGRPLPRLPPSSGGRLFRMRDRWPHHDLALGLRRFAARHGLAFLWPGWARWARRWRAFRRTERATPGKRPVR